MRIEILEDEYWWCGQVGEGVKMPLTKGGSAHFNMYITEDGSDQFAPLMLSSKGRYIWSEGAFEAWAEQDELVLEGKAEFILKDGFQNLKGAYLAAMKEHFPFTGETPDLFFFQAPQYNTWMELETEQTTEKILQYAQGILEHGYAPGVLMIDGGWQEDYGVFEFHRRKIPNPKELMDKLHEMGFRVMLWTSPIVSCAGRRFKDLRNMGYLCCDSEGKPEVREWWSGYSCFLDLTNPDAVKWFQGKLDFLMEEYGVDGFKFDGGDYYFYRDEGKIYLPVNAREQTLYYNLAGEKYRFNEYRAAWKCGGRPLMARLHDKDHTWEGRGINTIIPNSIAQGLAGYAYCCPDMVGGGLISVVEDHMAVDEELVIRWAFANAMMPMMQLSLAPWRILSAEGSEMFHKAAALHKQYGELFAELAQEAACTGEPIMRHMCYEFPGQGFETVNDQFMIGQNIMVAPVVTKGCVCRSVRFPAGKTWVSELGEEYEGGTTARVQVPLDRVPVFTGK